MSRILQLLIPPLKRSAGQRQHVSSVRIDDRDRRELALPASERLVDGVLQQVLQPEVAHSIEAPPNSHRGSESSMDDRL